MKTSARAAKNSAPSPAARADLLSLEYLVGCPFAMVSTGSDRDANDANIVSRDPFA